MSRFTQGVDPPIVASLGGGPSEAGLDWLRERSRGHKMSVLYDAGLYVRVDSPRFEGLSEGEDTYADQENSLVLNPDAWAITMFLSIVCCSGSDSVVLTRLQKFENGAKICMYIPSCVRSS